MSEITLAIREKGLLDYLTKNDKKDEYGNEDNFWLNFNQNIEECYFDDGELNISFNYNEDNGEPYLSVKIPLAELLEQFDRFDVAEKMMDECLTNTQRVRKILKLMQEIREKRDKEWKEHLEKLKEEKHGTKKS